MPKTNHFARNSFKLTLQAAACLALTTASMSSHALDIVFDYTYDTSSFFDASRKSLMDLAANAFESRLSDNLTAINSGVGGSVDFQFSNPSGSGSITVTNGSVAANELRVYLGAEVMAGSTLGTGGPGGYSASGTQSFFDNLASRGQLGALEPTATDFGPWGGVISFNSAAAWYFGTGTVGAGQSDFYSVAVHELGHVLGYGTADSWNAKVNSLTDTFTGAYSGTRALSSDEAHWIAGTSSDVNGLSQEAAMDPNITVGTRKYFTTLDYQGLQDIGWEVTAVPEPETYAMMLLGLGVLGWAGKRRKAA
jgi:hypothetical protein